MFRNLSWKKIRRGIKYPILVVVIKGCIYTVQLFPRKHVLRVSSFLGRIAFRLIRKEREKTIKNITLIYGKEKTYEEICLMAKEVFINQALNFSDYIYTLKYTTFQQFAPIIEIVGEDHLKNAYKEGKGVICMMSHTGSWEFSAILPSLLGYETSALSRPLPNPRIDKLIVEARQKRGMKNIGRGKAYPRLIEALKKGECLIIMIDQDTQAPGVFVDFLGRKAFTPVGAARLAFDSGSPVVPIYINRLSDNRHRLTISPPIPLINTGDREYDLQENTKLYTYSVENFVKEYPSQWVWMHERWKTTPEIQEQFLKNKYKKVD